MKYQIFLIGLIFSLSFNMLFAQNTSSVAQSDKDQAIISWLETLSQPGVSLEEDAVVMNAEAERLMTDENYRKEMYPEVYTWEKTMEFISKQELPKAFWYMINLYQDNDKNKELVLKSVLTYEQVFQMDKVLVSSFYTYIYMDLESSVFVDGVPEVISPDIMEGKLNTLKDILYFIAKFRENKTQSSDEG